MKKHYMILGIALFGGVFALAIYLLKGPEITSTRRPYKEPSSLTNRIEKLGKEIFSKESYCALVNEVEGLKSNRDINTEQANLLRKDLLNTLQKSLTLTFEQARDNCYASDLSAPHQAADTIRHKIKKLSSELEHHRNYKIALGYQGRLNSFLSGWYDEQKANNIKNGLDAFVQGKPFQQCSKIQDLNKHIANELEDFSQFERDFNNKKNSKQLGVWYDKDIYPNNVQKLKRYKAYYQEFITTQL